MWIRSQSKDALVNVNDICIYEVKKGLKIIYQLNCYGGSCYILGKYSTKEKAMKVMDMIKNAITGTSFEFTDIVRDCDLAGIEIHNVFNMPKDEEVK